MCRVGLGKRVAIVPNTPLEELPILFLCSEHDEELLAEKSKINCNKISDHWLKAKRNLNQLKQSHSTWLSSQTEVSIKKRKGSVGRPALSYLSKIHRSQRKEASDLATFKAGNVL